MADIVTAVTRVACNTSTGDQTITTGDFGGGTPKAAIFICVAATTDATAAADSALSFGAATGASNEWVGAVFSEDGVTTTNTARHQDHASCVLISSGGGGVDGEANFKEFAINGCVITWANAPSSAWLLTVIFLGGAHLQAFASNSDLGNTTDLETNITAPGFEPDVVMGFTHAASNAVATNAAWSIGAVSNDGVGGEIQRTFGVFDRHSQSTTLVRGRLDTTRTISAVNINTGAEVWGGDADTFDSSGFSIFTRTAGAEDSDIAYLALEFGGLQHTIVTVSTATTAESTAVTGIGFKPQLVIQGMTQIETVDTGFTDDHAGSWGISAFTPDAEFSAGVQNEDAASTTNAQSISDDTAINHPLDDGSSGIVASFTSMDSDGWTLDYTAVAGTARQFWALVIEEAATATVTDAIGTGIIPSPR